MEEFYQHLNKFRLEGSFCDVNLWAKFANNSDNVMGPFPAHKVVLAASCPTLQSIMTSHNIALDAADSETLPVLLYWVYGQRKKATDLIRSTAILKRVIYLAKCLGMRPFVSYLDKLESSLLPNSCVSATANLLSHALETTPVSMTPEEFKEKHAEEIEKAQKKATNNKTPKHNNNNNNNNNNDNGHYTVGDENNDDDDDDVVEDVTPVVASPASPDPYQDSTPGARKPGSHRLKGSPKAAAVVVPESEDTSCSSSSSSTSLPDIANNASKVQSPSNDYDQKKSPVRGRKRKTSIQAPDDQPSQQHHQSQQKPKRQQQQQQPKQEQQSDGESNARPKTSEEPVDAAANRSSKRHSIRGRGSAANEPEAAKSTEVKTDEEKPAEAESAEEKPAEPKIAEEKAIEGKSADAISDGASPVTQEGENDSLDAEQAMLQQETEDVVVPMETETNDDAPAEAASTGKNAAANTAAANTASPADAAGRGARSRRSRPGASLAEPESPATTAPPLPPPPPTKKSRQSRGGSTATEDEEEEQKTEVRNKAETKTKPEPKAGKRGSVAKADETAEDGDAGSGAGTPSDTKTPRTPSAGRGGTKRLSSAERSAVVQQSPSSSASAAEPSSSTSSASTMASLASTAEKLKIPEDVINMPYEQVVGATSPMTCYCHICGKMRYGHLLISQHYERSHNVKLKQDTPIICYVQKAEDFLAKCKWVQLQDLTAEMFPDLVCGVCYLNKSGKKNLFKHLKEKHDIEVDENDPEYEILVEKKMWEQDMEAVAGNREATPDSQPTWIDYATAPVNGNYQCQECDKPVSSKKTLKQHLNAVHEIQLDEEKGQILQVVLHRESSRKRKSTLMTKDFV